MEKLQDFTKKHQIKEIFLHKLPTKLIEEYDLICLKDLKVKNMVKNHKLAKVI